MKKPIKVVALSDLHGILPPSKSFPKCDLVLIAGDICHSSVILDQSIWLYKDFLPWLENLPAKKIIGVAGNHDWIWEKAPHLVPKLPWTYLQDNFCEYEGWKIYGSPWQPIFYDWAFNLDEPALARKWSFIPNDTDILVLHGPPKYYGDKVDRVIPGEDGFVGSPSLTEKILKIKPKLAVFGHIHPGYGVYNANGSTLANVSILDDRYQWTRMPTEFILDPDKKTTTATMKTIVNQKNTNSKEHIISWELSPE